MTKKVEEYAIVYRLANSEKWHTAAEFFVDDYDFNEQLKTDIYQAVDEFVDVARGVNTDDTD